MSSAPRAASTPAPSASNPVPQPAVQLPLNEMLRVMDVAREMRKSRESAEKALARDDFRTALRTKLMRSAELSGDRVTEAEIDAAIDTYLADRHRYADPPWSWQVAIAHLWVRRTVVLASLLALLLAGAVLWGMLFSSFAPLSPTVRAHRAAAVVESEADRLVDQIRAVSLEPAATAEAERLAAEVRAAGTHDPTTAIAATDRLRALHQQLLSSYSLRIVQDSDGSNLFDRTFDQADGSEKLSGHYVFVQAVDGQGNVVPQRIRNAETDREQVVRIWAERIPEDVYQRLRDDKLADGVLDETSFAVKRRGRSDLDMEILSSNGTPIQRSVQLTQW